MREPVKAESSPQEESGPEMTDVAQSYLSHKSSLMRFIGRFVRQPQDIEDIVQETFLKTYASEINTQIQSPKAFLFRTARNLTLKHLARASYRLTDYLEDFEPSEVLTEECSAENRAEIEEQFTAFCQAVRLLPVQCRRAFILRKVYGLTYKEIAEHLDISVNTVEKHLAAGIVKCSDYMKSKGYHNTDNRYLKKTADS